MSARRILSLMLLFSVGVAGGAGSALGQARESFTPSLGTYHALIIGNQAYRSLKPLTTPVADARAVATLLQQDYGFASVRVLTNATRAEIVRALDDLRQRLTERDNLLIYYAGHGWLDREADRGYWLPVDAEEKSRANWLSTVDITDTLRALRAKHVLVVADSCYGGTLTRDIGVQPLGGPDILQLAKKRARTALTSGGLEPVADRGGGGHSVFAKVFLDALRGARQPTDLASLFGGIRREVMLRAVQTPEYADIRQAGHDGGDFVFARPGARLAAVPPPLEVREEPRLQVGSLAVSAALAGIEVWLGDQRLGETKPGRALVVANVPEGTHQLRARKVGHKNWEREVRIAANQRAEVVIDIEPLGPAKVLKGDDGAEMVLVLAGEFLMGSDDGREDEKPPHRVWLNPYYIDRYEVTNALYRRFMEATGTPTPPFWNDSNFNAPSQPVVSVTWRGADAYCRWVGKRLPTEAEWEKAARGTDGWMYPWGNWDPSRTNSKQSALGKTLTVGSYPHGVSPYGAHDMAGNVYEWVADWSAKDYYQRSPARNPQGPAADDREVIESGRRKIVRGGSWDHEPFSLRTTMRGHLPLASAYSDLGFRCAKSSPHGPGS